MQLPFILAKFNDLVKMAAIEIKNGITQFYIYCCSYISGLTKLIIPDMVSHCVVYILSEFLSGEQKTLGANFFS